MLLSSPSRLRIIHSIINGPVLDCYIQDTKIISRLYYLSATPYLEIPSGLSTFKGRYENKELIHHLILNPNTEYTLILYKWKTSIKFIVLNDDIKCPNLNTSYVRFVTDITNIKLGNIPINNPNDYILVKSQEHIISYDNTIHKIKLQNSHTYTVIITDTCTIYDDHKGPYIIYNII